MSGISFAQPAGAACAHLRRRGRPPALQTAQRDAELLDMAERLFLERGFRQVSLALIARSAGVATHTITRFGKKREMLDRIIARRSGHLDAFAMLAAATTDSLAVLHRPRVYAFELELSRKAVLLHADALAARAVLAANTRHPLHIGLWYEMPVTVLEDGSWSLGKLPVTDVTVLADLFIGTIPREHARFLMHCSDSECMGEIAYKLATKVVTPVLRRNAPYAYGIGSGWMILKPIGPGTVSGLRKSWTISLRSHLRAGSVLNLSCQCCFSG